MNLSTLQRWALYLFFFSINFEVWAPLGGNFSLSRITGLLYFLSILPAYKYFFKISYLGSYVKNIWLFFGFLVIISIININSFSTRFFDFSIFQNIVLFWILLNHERKEPGILIKGMFCFALGSIVLSILYLVGLGVENENGRVKLFGDNENIIGIRMSISSIILLLIVILNSFNLKRFRFLLLAPIPLMLNLMADTGSRVSLLSFVLMFLTGILLIKTKKTWYKAIILAFGTIIFLYIVQHILQSEILMLRIIKASSEGDLAGRDIIWQKLIPLIKANPVFGVGISGYEEFANNIFGETMSPHNVIIEILCYSGIIGLAIYLIFIIRVFMMAISMYKIKKTILPILLLIPITGLIFSGQILNVKIGWLLFAYIIGDGLFSNKKQIQWKSQINPK